jgi:hypothetical protein
MSNKRIIRVRLKQDPSVEVVINTTEDNVPAKLAGIRKDIQQQKFARWAPFAYQRQSVLDSDTGWYFTIEGDNLNYVKPATTRVSADAEASDATMQRLNQMARDGGFKDLQDFKNSMTERAYAAKMVGMMRIINNSN